MTMVSISQSALPAWVCSRLKFQNSPVRFRLQKHLLFKPSSVSQSNPSCQTSCRCQPHQAPKPTGTLGLTGVFGASCSPEAGSLQGRALWRGRLLIPCHNLQTEAPKSTWMTETWGPRRPMWVFRFHTGLNRRHMVL